MPCSRPLAQLPVRSYEIYICISHTQNKLAILGSATSIFKYGNVPAELSCGRNNYRFS